MKFDDHFYVLLFSPKFEGEKFVAYQDSVGVWTIGAGTTEVDGKPVYKCMTCTHEQAVAWAKKDSSKFEQKVNDAFADLIAANKVNQNMFNALGLFCYNMGSFAHAKTLVATIKMNPVNFDHIEGIWLAYCKGHTATGELIKIPGLFNRRGFEFDLYKS